MKSVDDLQELLKASGEKGFHPGGSFDRGDLHELGPKGPGLDQVTAQLGF